MCINLFNETTTWSLLELMLILDVKISLTLAESLQMHSITRLASGCILFTLISLATAGHPFLVLKAT